MAAMALIKKMAEKPRHQNDSAESSQSMQTQDGRQLRRYKKTMESRVCGHWNI